MKGQFQFVLLCVVTLFTAACGGGGGGGDVPPADYHIGGTVTGLEGTGLVLQNNGGDDLAISGNTSFVFNTAVADGTAYSVTILSQPDGPIQTCAVNNSTGTVSGGNVTSISIDCVTHTAHFVYVANIASNRISRYSFDAQSERLRPRGYMPVSDSPQYIAIDPTQRYAYVTIAPTDRSNGSVAQYRLETDGNLVPLIPAVVTTSPGTYGVTIHPNGRFAYVTTSEYWNATPSFIYQYTIGANGTLTAMTPASVTAEVGTSALVIHPSGRHAYKINDLSSTISQYHIGEDGALTPMDPATMPCRFLATQIAIDKAGQHAYVVNGNINDLSIIVEQFTITANGALEPMLQPTVPTNGTSIDIVLHPNGRYAYVVNIGNGTISQYAIDEAGNLNALAPGFVTAGSFPRTISIDPGGRYVFVTDQESRLRQFAINADGTLEPATGSSVFVSRGPGKIAMTHSVEPVRDVPKAAYVTNEGNAFVSQYAISEAGLLQPLATPTVPAYGIPFGIVVEPLGQYAYFGNAGGAVYSCTIAGDGALTPFDSDIEQFSAWAVTADPSSRYVYVADYNMNRIIQYHIENSGALYPLSNSAVTTGNRPVFITIDTTGSYAYVAYEGLGGLDTGGIAQYRIEANGELSPLTPAMVPASQRFSSVVVHPTGLYAYATDPIVNRIYQFTVNNGVLTAMTPGSVLSYAGTVSIALDPTGRFAYVVNQGNNSVSQYRIGENGALIEMTPLTIQTGQNPRFISVDASGRYAYVANGDDDNVSLYEISDNGALTALSTATVASGVNPHWITTTARVQ